MVSAVLAPHDMRVTGRSRLDARMTTLDLGPVGIVDLQYGSDVRIDPADLTDHYLVHVARRGRSRVLSTDGTSEIAPDTVHVCNPGERVRIEMTRSCRHLAVRLPRAFVRERVERRSRQGRNAEPRFASSIDSPLAAQSWRRLADRMLVQFLDPSAIERDAAAEGFADAFLKMLLGSVPCLNMPQARYRRPSETPRHLRAAVEQIEQGLPEEFRVNALATRVGVSVRTLQTSFRRHLSTTPARYIRDQRLHMLQGLLIDGTANVTEAMAASGIDELGRYAAYFKSAFGLSPSDIRKYIKGPRN